MRTLLLVGVQLAVARTNQDRGIVISLIAKIYRFTRSKRLGALYL